MCPQGGAHAWAAVRAVTDCMHNSKNDNGPKFLKILTARVWPSICIKRAWSIVVIVVLDFSQSKRYAVNDTCVCNF